MPSPSLAQPWNADRRLDVLVLGPMGDQQPAVSGTAPIRDAVQALLSEPALDGLLNRAGVAPSDRHVHIPDGIHEQDIIDSVLSRLDIADLVIFNLTPKAGNRETSPNVFYELALVHALGIPAILLLQSGGSIPFYARGTKQQRVADFELPTLMDALREPLRDFLDTENGRTTNFVNDRVTLFYGGLPIVDISAAVGLATGYYQNFVSRLLAEGGFIAAHKDLIRQVVIVRPSSVDATYPADMQALRAVLEAAGYRLATAKLDPPPGDTLGAIWFEHVRDIVVDLPRTIYPIQRSPRLMALRGRSRQLAGVEARRIYSQRRRQIGENLLDRVEATIRFHLEHDGENVRASVLHFSTIRDAAALVTRLLAE